MSFFIFKKCGTGIVVNRVDHAPEILGWLPAEIVALVFAMRDIQIHCSSRAAPSRSVAMEVEPVAVGSECGREIVTRGVDVGTEILRCAPVRVEAEPL